MEKSHKDILRANHQLIINSLNFSNTCVLDELQADGVISSGEQEEILSHRTTREQNSALLALLKIRGPSKRPFDSFVNALSEEYSFIVEKLKHSRVETNLDVLDKECSCPHCKFQRNVVPSDVTHQLYEHGIIVQEDDLQELNNRQIPRKIRLEKLLNILKSSTKVKGNFDILRKCLEPKYDYIVDGMTDLNELFFCRQLSPSEVTLSDSRGAYLSDGARHWPNDYNTENCRKGELCFTNTNKDKHASEKLGSEIFIREECCVKEYSQHRIDISDSRRPQLKDNFSRGRKRRKYICTDNGNKKGQKASKRRQCFRKTRDSSEEYDNDGDKETSVGLKSDGKCRQCLPFKRLTASNREASGSDVLFQTVLKTLPTDKKLMRLCSKIWDKLFFLREKGDWETFRYVSDAAFQKFSDKPDIQVLLYRSEMCISTFYSNNTSKSLEMYDRAMQILPHTSMPNWHLARILPLKMELHTRTKDFEQAGVILKDAHQAMATLAPCLSTGAVYFFEAIYLGAILRCMQSGTKYTELSQRVKDCFLTAIKHYKQEKFFAIQSFLDQVYLFLALFSLGVDFKKIKYIGFDMVTRSDVDIANHYLNLFENTCWAASTPWSRMLFFIGRGEQHKQLHGYERSADYFKDAKRSCDQGKFEEQRDFILENLAYVNNKKEENIRLEELKQQSAQDILQTLLESTSGSSSCEDNTS